MHNYHIHIKGQVQGVGFRPFVYQAACARGLKGWVSNGQDGVHIALHTTLAQANDFAAYINRYAPRLARISRIEIHEVPTEVFQHFSITHSDPTATPDLLISPDFALCPECRQELNEAGNRREQYPFITCTLCGPRYSVMDALPYDRERTAMAPFHSCDACTAEYDDPTNRRYFSQTNSCPACGIQLGWFDSNGGGYHTLASVLLDRAAHWLHDEKILAVKGIGGFLLMADARSEKAVALLRSRKHRPRKPFAVLYPNLSQLEQDVQLSPVAVERLLGAVSPIILAPLQHPEPTTLALRAIAPGLSHLGVMLPYAPLLEALAKVFPYPVIATSGNISSAPIIYEEEKAIAGLLGIADAVLSHNRRITTPQDDSVLKFSPLNQHPIWMRRSRGLAPTLVLEAATHWHTPTLAIGADMKSAFTLFAAGNTYVSQYLGNLEHWDTQEQFRSVLNHLMHLVQARPAAVLADQHPGYFSSELARTLSTEWQVPLYLFPHHVAHFAAILAEHQLLGSEEPILGVVLDGTGLGLDQHIWGGEFFRYVSKEVHRIAHISYFPHLAGDKMARDGRLCALAACYQLPEAHEYLLPLFSETEWKVYTQLVQKPDCLQSSSMGRLFDAVAALCGIAPTSSYEGEAALLLEEAAYRWLQGEGWEQASAYTCSIEQGIISTKHLFVQILADFAQGLPKDAIATRFHGWVVEAIARIAAASNCKKITFSGGVLQNGVLTDWLKRRLEHTHTLYFHQELSPNDESISVGQLALFQEHITWHTSVGIS